MKRPLLCGPIEFGSNIKTPGREMAARIEGDLGEDIVIESRPRLEGRQMVMMIAPKKK